MLKISTNGAQANAAIKFALRPNAETLVDLSRPINPRHLKTRKQGNTTLTYCPWNTIAKHLHHQGLLKVCPSRLPAQSLTGFSWRNPHLILANAVAPGPCCSH